VGGQRGLCYGGQGIALHFDTVRAERCSALRPDLNHARNIEVVNVVVALRSFFVYNSEIILTNIRSDNVVRGNLHDACKYLPYNALSVVGLLPTTSKNKFLSSEAANFEAFWGILL